MKWTFLRPGLHVCGPYTVRYRPDGNWWAEFDGQEQCAPTGTCESAKHLCFLHWATRQKGAFAA